MGRGRIDTRARWHMVRRQGGFSLPSAVAERLEGALQGFGNRDAAAALARLLALAHRRFANASKTFAVCRRALARIAELGLSEDQVRGALAVLEKVGFLDRVGGGEWSRERQRRRAIVWRLGWAAGNSTGPARNSTGISGSVRKSPTEALRAQGNRLGGIGSPTRIAALAALERVLGEGVYAGKLSAAALAGRGGRWR